MKNPKDLKPITIGRLIKVGNSYGLFLPKSFVHLWELESKKKYQIQIFKEVK